MTRRIEVENVLMAANDCLLAEGSSEGCNIESFKEKIHANEVTYNLDELEIGKSTVDGLLRRDLAEGRCNKYTLKIISDGDKVTQWEQQKFENMKRANDAMKILRRQIANARRAGNIPPTSHETSVFLATKSFIESEQTAKQEKDADEISESELEEIEEQLTG